MTTILHAANVTSVRDYANASVSITYEQDGDKSSYGVNIDMIYLKEFSSFGVRRMSKTSFRSFIIKQ